MTKLETLKSLSKTVDKLFDLYEKETITLDQIDPLWTAFSPMVPNAFISTVLEKYSEDYSEELGENWKQIVDLFVEAPSYLIYTYCPDKNMEFNSNLFYHIWNVIVDAYLIENNNEKKFFEN